MHGDVRLRGVLDRVQRNPNDDLHPKARDWVARVRKNGGPKPSQKTILAISKFCRQIADCGLTPKLKACIPLVPDSVIAAITPLWGTVRWGNDPWTNVNSGFLAGDLNVQGLKGNASNYLRTGVIPSTCFAHIGTCGLTLYVTQNSGADAHKDLGCNAITTYEPALLLYPCYSGTTYWDSSYGSGTGRISLASTFAVGYFSGNRTAANNTAVYIARSTYAHRALVSGSATASGLRPTLEIYAFSGNQTGSSNAPSQKRHSFIAIHDGFTLSESAAWFAAIQNFRQRLGGGWL